MSFSYTLPTNPTGLPAAELAVLQDAVVEHAKISVVNIMTFDYYFGTTEDMLADTESAAAAAHDQLAALYPGVPARAVWGRIGITQMPGIDDFGAAETFPVADAPAFLRWAAGQGSGSCRCGRCSVTMVAARAPRGRAAAPGWTSRRGTSATSSSRSAT